MRAVNDAGLGAWSPADTFGIARPKATGPASPAASLRPTLTWTAVEGTVYEVRLTDLSTGKANIFPGVRVAGEGWTPTADLVSGRVYSWKVRALNDGGLGKWSDKDTFTVARPTLAGPVGDDRQSAHTRTL